MSTERRPNVNALLLASLVAAGLAGNYFKFTIFLNIDFLFGSIFAMLALQLFGLSRGVAAAAVIGGYTYFLWNHPYAVVILTLEAATVGLLMSRRRFGMIAADALYWTVIGIPLVYLFYHGVMQVPLSNTYIVMTKQAVNGIANAIVARLLFTAFALRSRSTLISFSDLISSLLAFFVLVPALMLLAIGSRKDFAETDRQIRAELVQEIGRDTKRLETWVFNRKGSVITIAELAQSKTPEGLQPFLEQAMRSDRNFKRIGLVDRSATTVAFSPLLDEYGQRTTGKNYADRPFIPTLKQTLKPMLSEVVWGRIGHPEPVVSVLAPVVVRQAYAGYVIGVLSLQQIRDHLDKSANHSSMLYTLLDKNGNVIMSNRPDQKVMTPFARGKGTLYSLDHQISQWVPVAPANTPLMERWKKSFYCAESTIGDLAEWRLIMEQPVAPFQKRLYDSYTQKLTLLFVILLMSLALGDLVSRRIMATFENLRKVTSDLPSRLESGASVEWPQSGIAETSDLIDNFQQMSGSLQQHLDALKGLNDSLEQRVAERTRQVERLASEQRTILSTMPIGACLLKDRVIRMANPAFDRIMGYGPGETLGMDTAALYPDAASYLQVGDSGRLSLSQGEISTADIEMKRKDGSLIWCNLAGQMVKPGSAADGSIWIIQDISERKAMEAQLRASETHYRLLTEDVADVVWKLDRDFRFTYISPADERLRGYRPDEVIGHTIYEVTPKQWHEAVAETMGRLEQVEEASAAPPPLEIQQRCRDGSLIWTEIFFTTERGADGSITGYHGITRDITQRKQSVELEQQMLHAQKLESLGVLAGGIAHDFNNILMAIMGNADLAMMHLNGASPAQENLRRIEEAAARAADLTKQMLAYSGKGRFVVEAVDLNRLLADMAHLLEISVSKKVILKFDLRHRLPSIDADAEQLRQIVMNLVINASEAMGDASGEIAISTGCEECGRNQLKEAWQESLPEGMYVYLMVTDTGCGMDKETLAKLFDPFFTTKFTGRGLGMAAVQGIVRGHKGSISIYSEPGLGSTFKVLLPASGPLPDPPLDVAEESQEQWRGSGAVLLVDDEETVRDIGAAMLAKLGFTPVVARDGQEAVDIFRETPDIAFVLLDLTMPRMDGRECLRRLRELAPGVKVIMSSGYNEQELARECRDSAPDGFLQKPYHLASLRDAIRRFTESR